MSIKNNTVTYLQVIPCDIGDSSVIKRLCNVESMFDINVASYKYEHVMSVTTLIH